MLRYFHLVDRQLLPSRSVIHLCLIPMQMLDSLLVSLQVLRYHFDVH